MPTPLPRWSRNRVLRHRARGTSDALLRLIFRGGGPRPTPGEPAATAASNIIAFRPLDASGPGATRPVRAGRPRGGSARASSAAAVAGSARDHAGRP